MTREPQRMIGPWGVRSCRVAYENPWIVVEHNDVVQANGQDGIYGVVRFANLAVGVLPLFDDGTTVLVGQHRFPFDDYSWELPEGGGSRSEAPEEAARRELLEETGLSAGHWAPFGRSHLSNSVTDEVAVYFLAWDLTEGRPRPDGDEVFGYRRVPFAQLLAECLDGHISDALTVLMVQTATLGAQYGRLPDRPTELILGSLEDNAKA
jgi:8-oxo-dGTP pyrophosphatase MutT (NUDIX family)